VTVGGRRYQGTVWPLHAWYSLQDQLIIQPTHHGTLEEKRAWLSIPVFARPPGHLTYLQRMEILRNAFAMADKSQPVVTEWRSSS